MEVIRFVLAFSIGLLFLGSCLHILPFLYLAMALNAICIPFFYDTPLMLILGSMLMLNLMFIWLVRGNNKLMEE